MADTGHLLAERAGLVDCTAHGIRKAAARRLAEAGATVNQLMAIFGWTRPDMASSTPARRARSAWQPRRSAGLSGSKPRTSIPSPPFWVGERRPKQKRYQL